MAKCMLIDSSHPEETRVVVQSGNRLEDFDYETSSRKQLKGNIYLAKVTRVEPSLQAAFVEYGGNRHENGRASCRERVCQSVSLSVVAVSLKHKTKDKLRRADRQHGS